MQELINEVYQLISAVPVTGDYVDVMAEVRGKLRQVYKILGKKESDAQIEQEDENG